MGAHQTKMPFTGQFNPAGWHDETLAVIPDLQDGLLLITGRASTWSAWACRSIRQTRLVDTVQRKANIFRAPAGPALIQIQF
jgi:hypothetical protein